MRRAGGYLGLMLAIAGLLLLLGCADTAPAPAAQPLQRRPVTLGANKPRRSSAELPAEARAALEQLGLLTPSASGAGRHVSNALPYQLPANQQYGGPGGAGYVGMSADIAVSPTEMTMQPAGATYPGNFSYLIYRVDDITQPMTTLDLNFGLLGPGAQIGVAAYNWGYGSRGRWEPLFFGDALPGMSLALTPPAGGSFLSPGDDFAFAVFCLNPSTIELQGFEVSSQVINPNYDEVEPNDVFEDYPGSKALANPLPAFPFTGLRGNVGSSGVYDGSVDDYFWFTGQVGEMYRFTITPANPNPDFTPYVFESDGYDVENEVAEPIMDEFGVITLTVVITPNQSQPLYVDVWNKGAHTDYTLDGELVTAYGELEDNDDAANANPQPAPVFFVNGQFKGSGDQDDLSDWFSFTPAFGEQPLLVLWYDPTQLQFDFGADPPVVTDFNGNTLCTGVDSSGFIPDTVSFNFAAPLDGTEPTPFLVKLNPANGSGTNCNYWLNRYFR